MPYNETIKINAGHLEIGGCDAVDLAQIFGTPLYVMDEATIRRKARAYQETLVRAYPNSLVLYAGKAFLTTAMCRLMDEEGLGLDVVSGGELYTALRADFPPEKIFFHGNNKSEEELNLALESGVGRIVVDNLYELELLNALAARQGKKASILLRLTPGVEAHTHEYIQTGQVDSKFGIGLVGDQAFSAVRLAMSLRNIRLLGFHSHIGSQVFEAAPYQLAAEVLLNFVARVKRELGLAVKELDLGGGLGIRYLSQDDPPLVAVFLKDVVETVVRKVRELGLEAPRLILEPGRSIIGDAGLTLYRIGSIKEIPGVRTYVAVDGGMADNPRVALYGAKYEAIVANRADAPLEHVVSIAGRFCESGDMLLWDAPLPRVTPGDLLAVFSTGAYHYSMASNYNRFGRPAVVLVHSGQADLIVRRETYADLVAHDIMPERLRARGEGYLVATGS
ncbi:MAG: diaminopimelate decarboxylase [Firmicutes bacterium]|nr:diaminopimelate decarboxylase [Bacillota bacterium]